MWAKPGIGGVQKQKVRRGKHAKEGCVFELLGHSSFICRVNSSARHGGDDGSQGLELAEGQYIVFKNTVDDPDATAKDTAKSAVRLFRRRARSRF